MTPCEKASRDRADLTSCGKMSEQEVVVLGPVHILISDLHHSRPPYEPRGMGQGTLDETVALNIRPVEQAVEPFLVLSDTATQVVVARKEPSVATEKKWTVGPLGGDVLRGQTITMHDIVAVHSCDERPSAMLQPQVERRHDSLPGSANDTESRVVSGGCSIDGDRPVGRSVVHQDALERLQSLALHAANAGRDRRLGVPHR